VGRSRAGLTTKIHARVDAKGRPLCLLISPGEVQDLTYAETLLDGLDKRARATLQQSQGPPAQGCRANRSGPLPDNSRLRAALGLDNVPTTSGMLAIFPYEREPLLVLRLTAPKSPLPPAAPLRNPGSST
jgi:hypothetical protein